jgi:hypothetical protein
MFVIIGVSSARRCDNEHGCDAGVKATKVRRD